MVILNISNLIEKILVQSEKKEISSLWDLASHDISILKFLFKNIKIKKKIKFIQNKINNSKVSDIYNLNFYIKKIPVNINVSWLYPEKIRQINIIGDKKILLFDELNIKIPLKFIKFLINIHLQKI